MLWQLGLEHSYHSEEFNHFVWAPHADKFWLDKRQGWRSVDLARAVELLVFL